MKYTIWIVTPPNYIFSQCFFDQAYPLQEAIRELGHECDITDDVPAFSESNVIVLGAHLLQNPIPKNWIIYNLEQIEEGSKWITGTYVNILRQCKVWDYQEGNSSKLGIIPQIVKVGYMPCMEKITKVPPMIDVLHYGSMNERRQKIIQALSERGINVQHAFKVYGKLRDDILARTKIVLNISYYESKIFNITRCGYLFANKIAVVSEDGPGSIEGAALYAPYESLVDACINALNDYEAIGNNGYEVFKGLKQTDYLKDALCSQAG